MGDAEAALGGDGLMGNDEEDVLDELSSILKSAGDLDVASPASVMCPDPDAAGPRVAALQPCWESWTPRRSRSGDTRRRITCIIPDAVTLDSPPSRAESMAQLLDAFGPPIACGAGFGGGPTSTPRPTSPASVPSPKSPSFRTRRFMEILQTLQAEQEEDDIPLPPPPLPSHEYRRRQGASSSTSSVLALAGDA